MQPRRIPIIGISLALSLATMPVFSAGAGNSPYGDAAVPWPASFDQYGLADGSPIIDTADANPAYSDIWSGPGDDLGATYFESDGTNVFIRMRVRGAPDSKNGGFQSTSFTISIGAGGSQAAVIGLNGKPSATDFVYTSNADGSVIREIYQTPFTNDGAGTSAGARWMAAADAGYFVDFQIPIAQITAVAPSVTPTTPVQLFFGTSQAANLSVINKDYMRGSEVSYLGLATVTLSGAPVGSPPSAADDGAVVAEDGSVTIAVTNNDTDPDGNLDPTTVTIDVPPGSGLAVANGDGTITYTPDPDYVGGDAFSYEVCDTTSLCDTATVNVTVTPANDPPIAGDDTPTVAEDASVTIDVLANDSDIDSTALSITGTTPAGNGSVLVNPDNTVTYTPDPDYNGTDTFTYTVCDDGGLCDTATVTVTVTPVNDDPVAGHDTAVTPEDAPLAIDVLANDTDVDGDPLTISAFDSNGTAGGTVACPPAGPCTYTPPPGFSGTESFTYTVSDGTGATDTATVTVTVVGVNDPPGVNDDSVTITEGTSTVIPVLANDTDPDGDTLSIDFFTQPAAGTITDNLDGTVTYAPPHPDYNGTTAFTYRACDDGTPSLCAEATVTIIVTSENDAPTASPDTTTTDEGSPVVINVLANDSDVDGDALSVSSFDAVSADGGTVTCDPAGDCTYSPPGTYNGTDTFSYTVSDGNGGFDTALVTITVWPVNTRPTAVDDAASVAEDTPTVIPGGTLTANDSDPDGPFPLVVTAVTNGAHGTATVVGGDVLYSPDPDFNGTDTITYTVCDGGDLCDTAQLIVTVNAINDPPVAKDDTATTDEDTPVTISVFANDSDVDGDSLSVAAVTDPPNGSAVINPDNTITYTPDPDYFGLDDFQYTVSDGNGGFSTATVQFVTVNPVNDAPVAADDTPTVAEDTPVTIDVLGNDTDVDDVALTVITVTDPPNGTAVINPDNTITYTPDPDYNGTDTFTYTVCDTGGLCDGATITADVDPANDDPTAADDTPTVAEDTPVTIDVLANDTDIDGDTLSVAAVTDPPNGTAVINPDNTITYTPDPDYHGTDTFTYTASDGNGGTTTATVIVTISPVNDAPTVPATMSVSGVPGTTPPPLDLGDPDSTALTVRIVAGDLPPGLTLNTDGTWSGAATVEGTFSVSIEVCDDADPPACTPSVLSIRIELLPVTGVTVAHLVRWATVLLLGGWVTLTASDRNRRRARSADH